MFKPGDLVTVNEATERGAEAARRGFVLGEILNIHQEANAEYPTMYTINVLVATEPLYYRVGFISKMYEDRLKLIG